MESVLQQNGMIRAEALLPSASFEVTPRSWKLFLSRSADGLGHILPGTKVFIAHIIGVPIKEMVETARMLRLAGADPVPHIPARLVPDKGALQDWFSAYRGEAGVTQALVIAGGIKMPAGDFASSMDLVATGQFDSNGFTDLAFAGHPEGSRDVDPEGGSAQAEAALRWKQAFRDRTGLGVSLITQFVFASGPVLNWAARLRQTEIDLPITVGLAGPTKLSDLIRYGVNCGVGASLAVLQHRALELRKLLRPVEPDSLLLEIASRTSKDDTPLISGIHFFPFGGLHDFLTWQNRALRNGIQSD